MTATVKTTVIQEPSSSIVNLTLNSSGGISLYGGATTVPAGTGTVAIQGLSTNVFPMGSVTPSGTNINFGSIPSWVKRVTIVFNVVTTSGTSVPLIQLGTSGGVVSTGYVASGTNIQNGASPTSTSSVNGLFIYKNTSSENLTGTFMFHNITGNTWVGSGNWISTTTTVVNGSSVASIVLSSALTQVNITTGNGIDNYTGGTINVFYE